MLHLRKGISVSYALLLTLALLISGCQPIQPLPIAAPANPDPEPSSAETVPGDPFAGAWEGAIQIAGIELGFLLTITGDSETGYSATMDIPQQGATGLPVGNILVEGDKISFTILEGTQQATFSGSVSGDAIQGTFGQSGQEGSFTLAREAESASGDASPAEAEAGGASGIASVYTNEVGSFSVPIPTNWTVSEADGVVTLLGPEGDMTVHLLSLPVEDGQEAITAAWAQIDPDFAFEIDETVEPPASAGYDAILVNAYDTGDDNRIIQVAALLSDGVNYVMIYDLGLESVQRRAAQISIIDSGFKVLAMADETLSPDDMGELSDALLAEWEQAIAELMVTFEVPGAAVGVVMGDELVYAKGFGDADPASGRPMTTDTQMMIGSTTKSFSTLLMGTLVDDGVMTWDTPAKSLYPDFAVKDETLSDEITMRNLVCACTGVPRRDMEFIFNWDEMDAADVVASLRDFEFFTDFGEAFQYSNQMVATGGYIAGLAAEPDAATLEDSYAAALAERVTGPIGMPNTTLSLDDVLARNNYATPHGAVIEGGYEPIPLEYEESLQAIGPAGGLWSTVEDMSRYMVTQLNNGVAPDGNRVISEENLLITRAPQVKIDSETSYGLGWIVGAWRDLPVIEHSGNTLGFTSDFAFLPTTDMGIIVLANAQGANLFSSATRMWLLERLFAVDGQTEEMVQFYRTQMDESQAELDEKLAGDLDIAAVEPFVGQYTSPVLGALELRLEDGRLFADAGEFSSEMLSRTDDDGAPDGFLTADPPLPGLPFYLRMDGEKPTIVMGQGLTEYTFTPVQ